jgi:DNA-directed RNA polymerase specialized sigma24 family protein
MDENELLQQLVSQAQSHPDRRIQRKKLDELIRIIRKSPSLSKQSRWSSIPNFKDIYDEALYKALAEICEQIDKYNPSHPVMAWVNRIFNFRFTDIYNDYQRRGLTGVPGKRSSLPKEQLSQILQWFDLDRGFKDNDKDRPKSQEISASPFEDRDRDNLASLIDLIEEDPDGLFANQHIEKRPEVTFQKIVLMRLKYTKWNEISKSLNIPLPTLHTFYKRAIKEDRELLKYLKEKLKY